MPGPDRHFRTCNLCEAMCGIEIQVERGKITAIKGDPQDPLSRGHICPKAVALQDLHDDPDRLRYPMLRTPQGWERISWDNAFNETAARLRNIQAKHGKNAVGMYVGNPSVHNHGTLLTLLPLLQALNTENRYSATSVDQLAPMLASLKMFGNQLLFPIPDIDNTHYFLCLGANPMASNGSLMTAPGFKTRIKALQARGGRFIVVDPRRTESADLADQHHFIRPGTDALFLMALIHSLFHQDLVNLGNCQPYTQGLNILRNLVTGFTPDKVARKTGISAATIKRIARDFATSPSAVVYGRMGISTQAFGGATNWLINVLNIITGRLDQPGGAMFTDPAIDLAGLAQLFGQTGTFNTRKSRVRGLPEFGGEFPAATLADEILTPGDGQIKALVTCAGNPVLSTPNGRKLDEALGSLDFMVSVDFYLNETTRHADIILPPTGPLEHGHYDLIFNTVSVRNTVKYSPPVFNPAPDTRHDWEIFLELARRFKTRSPLSWLSAETQFHLLNRLGADGLLDLLLRSGPYGNKLDRFSEAQERAVKLLYDRLPTRGAARLALDLSPYNQRHQNRPQALSLKLLEQHPHGIDLGPLQPGLPHKLATRNRQINLAPKVFLKDISRLQAELDKPARKSPETFLVIGRRQVRSNNSWMHNSYRLVKGKVRCTAEIHPEDAARLQIADGELITVSSRVGEIRLPASITDRLMPGVISIPHGWGHDRPGIQLHVAASSPGVSLNDITDERLVDQLTGVAAFSGQPVTVSKVTAASKVKRLNDARLAAEQ